MESKTDLLTGQMFVPTRINQRFQNAKNRIVYYNQKANRIRHMKSEFDKPLHRNYLILLELMKGNKETVFHKQYLLGKGYHFGVYTHLEEHEGNSCFAIYEFLVLSDGSDQIKFVRND